MTRAEALDAMIEAATPAEMPHVAADLARALSLAIARSAHVPAPTPVAATASESLTIEEAAVRMGVAKTWLYRHAKQLPFTRKLGHRTLRFDARGLERWLRQRRCGTEDDRRASA